MKHFDDTSLQFATMRYTADRMCLWRLCGKRACLRARTCKGDVGRCTLMMAGWIEAMGVERRRMSDNFAALEDEIENFQQLRVYVAWRKLLDQAPSNNRGFPRTPEEESRLRYELASRLTGLTVEQMRKDAARRRQEESLIVGEGREEEKGEEEI